MAGGFPLRVNGILIYTSEALYQACRFPHMAHVQRKIIQERSPMTAKMRAKPFRNDSRRDWDAVRVRVMRWCLRVKLAQNWQSFSTLLLATGNRPIVERSRKDDFWGAKVIDSGVLIGRNALGRLLMELREQLRDESIDRLRLVRPLSIPSFLLLDQPIQPICATDPPAGAPQLARGPDQSARREPPPNSEQSSLFEEAAAFGQATSRHAARRRSSIKRGKPKAKVP